MSNPPAMIVQQADRDAAALEPCPWCGDPMMWIEDGPCFGHTPKATEAAVCFARHSLFHADQIDWWNARHRTAAISSILAEKERLEKELADKDEARLRYMGPMPEGGWGMELEGGPLHAFTAHIIELMTGPDGQLWNCMETEVRASNGRGSFTLTVQRRNGKAPMEMRKEAEARAEAAEAKLASILSPENVEKAARALLEAKDDNGEPLIWYANRYWTKASAAVFLARAALASIGEGRE